MRSTPRLLTEAIVLCVCAAAFFGCKSRLAANVEPVVVVDPIPEPNPHAEPPPNPEHLVGHEDAATLARVQDVIDAWDPRRMENPYLKAVPVEGQPKPRSVLRRPDLAEFIADPEAAVALGKALYWDMQAGSDFGRRSLNGRNAFVGTSCASCHYQNGTDGRTRNTTRVPYVAWSEFETDPAHPAKDAANPGEPRYSEGEFKQWPFKPNADPSGEDERLGVALITGSQGVEPRLFKSLNGPATRPSGRWDSEVSVPRTLHTTRWQWDEKLKVWKENPYGYQYAPEWSMFLERPGDLADTNTPNRTLRQITNRNSQVIANAVFSDRLFHDGRAESTFNGFSIFGDHDRREILYKRQGHGPAVPAHVAITQAALASQAVGPIVNEVEMSYFGRTFHDLADKLLDKPWLQYQDVSPTDSVLSTPALYTKAGRLTYRDLVRRAFREEWWADGEPVDLALQSGNERRKGTLMQANFSLYWGLSILLYESTQISDKTPFDAMLRGDGGPADERWDNEYKARLDPVSAEIGPLARTPAGRRKVGLASGTAVLQLGFRTFMNRGCVECHSGPLFSEAFEPPERSETDVPPPIDFRITRTLLPNAQADAIAIRMSVFRQATEAELRTQLARLNVPESQYPVQLRALWRLLDSADGNDGTLRRLVAEALPSTVPVVEADGAHKRISNLLMTYEKSVSTQVGGRTFFPETDRVTLAETLAGNVLVEKVLLPAAQRMVNEATTRPVERPPLPIGEPPATQPYAFYDTGFYDLGVSPPRFDRGIGQWTADPTDDIDPATAATRPTTDTALHSTKRAASPDAGPRGSAYQFRRAWAAPSRSINRRNSGTKNPQQQVSSDDPDVDPNVTARRRDFSWSRNEFPPADNVNNLEFDHRRSDVHFFSRSRRLVFNEEPTGYRKPFLGDNELDFWGAFKTPTLRNVELTAPYMHNGRLFTLDDVIGFYDNGGALWQGKNNPDKHPAITPLNLSEDERKGLHFFLACLTDERLRLEKAPFDHPSLIVIDGYEKPSGDVIGDERAVVVAATGNGGRPGPMVPVPTFAPATPLNP